MSTTYLETTKNVYKEAAKNPQVGLCCTTTPFDDGKGHVLFPNQPLEICCKTGDALSRLGRDDIYISGSTFFYDGGGCC